MTPGSDFKSELTEESLEKHFQQVMEKDLMYLNLHPEAQKIHLQTAARCMREDINTALEHFENLDKNLLKFEDLGLDK